MDSSESRAVVSAYAARKLSAATCLYGSGACLVVVMVAASYSKGECCAIPAIVLTFLAASIVLVVTAIALDSHVLNTCQSFGDSQIVSGGTPSDAGRRACQKCGADFVYSVSGDEPTAALG